MRRTQLQQEQIITAVNNRYGRFVDSNNNHIQLIIISDNTASEYIPAYAISDHIISGDIVLYDLKFDITSLIIKRLVNSNLYNLLHSEVARKCELGSGIIYIGKGIVYTLNEADPEAVPDVLMVLCLKPRVDFINLNKGRYIQYNDDDFVLLISPKFEKTDWLKAFYKNLDKRYIQPAFEAGIDIVYTNHIMKRVFSNSLEIPKFHNITELNTHLEQLNELIYE